MNVYSHFGFIILLFIELENRRIINLTRVHETNVSVSSAGAVTKPKRQASVFYFAVNSLHFNSYRSLSNDFISLLQKVNTS